MQKLWHFEMIMLEEFTKAPPAGQEVALHSDIRGQTETESSFRRHVSSADLISLQPQDSQPGEVHHVHHTAETAQCKLWNNGKHHVLYKFNVS